MTLSITVQGKLRNDPVSYVNRAGDLRVDFIVVTLERRHISHSDEWRELETQVHVQASGKLAEEILQQASEGMEAVVTASQLKAECWRDENGSFHARPIVVASGLRLSCSDPQSAD